MKPRPVKCVWNEARKTARLYFDAENRKEDGEYQIRGGVCWPMVTPLGSTKEAHGFIILAGMNLSTRQVTVFEEQAFKSVDHIVDPNNRGNILEPGISNFFNVCWAVYGGLSYFWHCEEATHFVYQMQVHKSQMIQPKPRFMNVPWEDDRHAEQIVWRVGNAERRLVLFEGPLSKCLLAYQVQPPGDPPPPFRALMTCLAGFDRYPWRDRGHAEQNDPRLHMGMNEFPWR